MKSMFVVLQGENGQEETREYEVDDDAVPFGICSQCPRCEGLSFVYMIDEQAKMYECASVSVFEGQAVTVKGLMHPIPSKICHFEGGRMVTEHPYDQPCWTGVGAHR